MDHRCSPCYISTTASDWLLDNLRSDRKFQDKDPDICFLYKLYLMDNLYLIYIQVYSLRKDFQCNLLYRNKSRHYYVPYIQRLRRMAMGNTG